MEFDPPGHEVGRPDPQIGFLERRLGRERRARKEAEMLMEVRARQLFEANERLSAWAEELESRVQERSVELVAAREAADRRAETDYLTELDNGLGFATKFETFVSDVGVSGVGGASGAFALLLVDLDRLARINTMFGHAAGDDVLRMAARRIERACHGAVIVARLRADVFAVLIRSEAAEEQAASLAQKLLAELRQPIPGHGRRLDVTASIGIALYPQHGTTLDQLHRNADLALHHAKADRATACLYDVAMGNEQAKRQALAIELSHALFSNQIEPWFQPIVETATGRVRGAEILARWRHPTLGLLSPGAFLPLIEERLLMDDLFALLLRTVSPLVKRWVAAGALHSVSLNISPSQFKSGNLVADILDLIREVDLPASMLTIEITEEIITHDFNAVRAQLTQLSDHGVRLALDDFGIGYSNVGILRHLSFDTLKVDRSLTAEVASEDRVRAVLSSIIGLARALGMAVVAEGIEHEAQAEALAQIGFEAQQGYLFGRPMPACDFERHLARLCPALAEAA